MGVVHSVHSVQRVHSTSSTWRTWSTSEAAIRRAACTVIVTAWQAATHRQPALARPGRGPECEVVGHSNRTRPSSAPGGGRTCALMPSRPKSAVQAPPSFRLQRRPRREPPGIRRGHRPRRSRTHLGAPRRLAGQLRPGRGPLCRTRPGPGDGPVARAVPGDVRRCLLPPARAERGPPPITTSTTARPSAASWPSGWGELAEDHYRVYCLFNTYEMYANAAQLEDQLG